MKGFDTLKVKSAVKTRNNFDLSFSHLTTMDFGEIIPLAAIETVPGDKFNIGAEYFSRMAPLVVPTYGRFNFRTVAGFVPFHQVADDAEAWLAGKTTFQGQTPKQRWFSVRDLHDFVVSYCVVSATTANCEYCYTNVNGTVIKNKFTPDGARMVKILNALGYALPQGADLQSGATWNTSTSKAKLSAYPLLAFAKLYNDYMSQSQRFNTSNLSDLLYRIKHGIAYSGFWNNSTGELYDDTINALLQNITLNYDNDYFTSAWQNPNAALNASESVRNGVDAPSVPTAFETVENVQLILDRDENDDVYLQQRALNFLRAFDDWVRRNNYSGSREVQQLYSRFGIKTDDYRSNYAQVIKTDSMPIQVGDVTSQASTSEAALGDYAGKGIMSGGDGFEFQSSDFGMLFILGYFTVVPMNAYGSDKSVLRTDPLAYYNPEFDGVGCESIGLGEFYASPIQTVLNSGDTTSDTDVFGFTERYNSYRYGRDKITGEFRNYHPDGDMNAWHTGRNLAAVRAGNQLIAQSSAVNTLEKTDSQYNRIFSITSDIVNHFYLTCRFNVKAVRPMLNLNQVPNLGEGNTVVPRNGNVIS